MAKKLLDETLEMAELYRSGLTLQQLGDRYCITQQGIQQRFRNYGVAAKRSLVEVRFKSILARIDKTRLIEIYSQKTLTLVEIAEELEIGRDTLNRLLAFYEIPKRGWKKSGGKLVDLQRSLKIGDSYEIPVTDDKTKYISHHTIARQIGIKVKTKRVGDVIKVTRIA